MSAPDGFQTETRDAGQHEWGLEDICRHCHVPAHRAFDPCPSVQERRLVGPWEPVLSNERGERDE